jgi:hypothetical protein
MGAENSSFLLKILSTSFFYRFPGGEQIVNRLRQGASEPACKAVLLALKPRAKSAYSLTAGRRYFVALEQVGARDPCIPE